MKRTIYIQLIAWACALLPTLTHAQGTRQIQGMVTLSDDAVMELFMGSTFNCYVYSFYNKEDADKNIKDFKEMKIKYNGVPSSDYQDAVRVQFSGEKTEIGFKIEAVNDGYIMVLVNKDDYEVKPELRKVTKNMTAPAFNIEKRKVKAKTGDMTKDTQELDEVPM